MTSFVMILSFLGAVGGGITLLITIGAAGAPQQAAGAGIALALAVIPYVFARSVQLTLAAYRERDHRERLIDRLESLERALERKA